MKRRPSSRVYAPAVGERLAFPVFELYASSCWQPWEKLTTKRGHLAEAAKSGNRWLKIVLRAHHSHIQRVRHDLHSRAERLWQIQRRGCHFVGSRRAEPQITSRRAHGRLNFN